VATTTPPPEIPVLGGESAEAVAHRGGHLQIIAAAGSGKTEVVSQRVASLVADGEVPESIVAFTFTEKAAEELRERIAQRVTARVGESATDQLGRLFVGTIHSYCFRLLQAHVSRYETYTPLDENQLVNLLYREGSRLELKQFAGGKLFKGIHTFLRSVDVVENELIDPGTLPLDNFRVVLEKYYVMLDGYRFMSFGTQIVRAVEALQDPDVHARVTAELRHLIVDEYQDINPAQERLIELLAKPKGQADLAVVGDDDQAIYQWRGSSVDNIVTFAERYDDVTPFRLLVNRRSRPAIVALANAFAQTIPGRLTKQMSPDREAAGSAVSLAVGFDDEETEADAIAMDIEALHGNGVPYGGIAILVRGKVAYGKILDALEHYRIPVQPGGRSGLFEQPEAALFGATYAWMAEIDWAPGRFIQRKAIERDDLVERYADLFALNDGQVETLRVHLVAWRDRTRETDFQVSLVGDFYTLLGLLGVSAWDTTDEATRNRLGTIARFTSVLADYETVTRRSRRDPDNPGEQVGGQIGGAWFYRNLALLLVNYAIGSYDDFEGEEDVLADGVALGTVHGAKGLEWPVVFLPSLTDGRFPSSRTGTAQDWLVPRDWFDAGRYEGSDGDERRLFYVALTRARDWVALSSHRKVNKQTRRDSPYLTECVSYASSDPGHPTPAAAKGLESPDLAVTYSELAAYDACPHAYLLRNQLGFMPPIQAELGYGNAVHHLMRVIAEHTQAAGRPPTPSEIDDMLTTGFYLPFANKPAHKEMREKARKLVSKYVNEHQGELLRTWATERPFELYLPGVVISGRADVIYDDVDGTPENLVIVDYKTSTRDEVEPLQLQVYADAGRREGLSVRGAVIEDMATEIGHDVPVDPAAVAAAEARVVGVAEALKQRDFTPKPELSKCRRCDVRTVCRAAKLR
jgi:DNA helicase-2/ATP-dependent DNA helicase PcrA